MIADDQEIKIQFYNNFPKTFANLDRKVKVKELIFLPNLEH